MSTKRIIILGGGFGGVKWTEMQRDEFPLGYHELDEIAPRIRLARRRRRPNALTNHRVEIERRRTR